MLKGYNFNGQVEKTDNLGAIYQGMMADGKKEGPGIKMCPDGNYYDGSWNDNEMHGDGFFEWAGVAKYKGQFSKGK